SRRRRPGHASKAYIESIHVERTTEEARRAVVVPAPALAEAHAREPIPCRNADMVLGTRLYRAVVALHPGASQHTDRAEHLGSAVVGVLPVRGPPEPRAAVRLTCEGVALANPRDPLDVWTARVLVHAAAPGGAGAAASDCRTAGAAARPRPVASRAR